MDRFDLNLLSAFDIAGGKSDEGMKKAQPLVGNSGVSTGKWVKWVTSPRIFAFFNKKIHLN